MVRSKLSQTLSLAHSHSIAPHPTPDCSRGDWLTGVGCSRQIELFFASGLIRVSYADVADTSARMLVGLSGGELFSPFDYMDFVQRDLTSMAPPQCPDHAMMESFGSSMEEFPKTDHGSMGSNDENPQDGPFWAFGANNETWSESEWKAGDSLVDDAVVLVDPSTGLSYAPEMCPLGLAFSATLADPSQRDTGVEYPDDDLVEQQAEVPPPAVEDAASGLRIGGAVALAVTLALLVLA